MKNLTFFGSTVNIINDLPSQRVRIVDLNTRNFMDNLMRNWLKIIIVIAFCLPFSNVTGEKIGDHSTYVQHVEQGFAQMFRGNNRGAISEFEAALTIEPDHYEVLHYLGMAYAQEEFSNKAAESYQRSLALMPDNIEALYSLGVVYFKLDKWPDAVTALQRVVELSPQHARGYEVLGKTLVKATSLRRRNPHFDAGS